MKTLPVYRAFTPMSCRVPEQAEVGSLEWPMSRMASSLVWISCAFHTYLVS